MDNFKELTQTLIQTQVLQALKSAPEYVDALVQSAMQAEVGPHGEKPDFRTSEKMPWLEWCVRDALRQAARAAVLDIVREMEPTLKASVKKAMSSDELVGAFTKQIINNAVDYKINVEVAPAGRD